MGKDKKKRNSLIEFLFFIEEKNYTPNCKRLNPTQTNSASVSFIY